MKCYNVKGVALTGLVLMRSAAAFVILILSGSSAFAAVYHSDGLQGDVAISSTAGPVWPMKKWAYYDELKNELKWGGLKVNTLQSRSSVLERLAEVPWSPLSDSGDTFPMHPALGSGVRCVSIFTCKSPWEIYEASGIDPYFYAQR